MYNWTITGIALGFVTYLYIGRRALKSSALYLSPPGPPGLPWIGNATGVDQDAPWLTYAEWAKTYGDLIYIRLLGKDILVVNSEKVAKDLFENRSKNYADRPYFLLKELCGVEFTSFLQYGDRWRLLRRILHQTFRARSVERFVPVQHHRACQLLQRLFDAPEELHNHLFEYTAAVIMNSTYGYDPKSRQDELVSIAANVFAIISPLLRADINLILGAFPWLFYLPSWFPGMSFKKDMAVARKLVKHHLERLFEYSLQKVLSGSEAPSMIHDTLQDMDGKGTKPYESWMDGLRYATGTAFLAGSETFRSVLMTFFLVMMTYPEAQEKAHQQIEEVVGKGRLPTSDDRPLLPFIDAIFRETLRFNPVTPLSVPHAVIDDDVYNGFHIPKGAIVLPNLWAMSHDESKYTNPDAFIPERFLNDDGSLKPNDMEQITYGWGRRVCAGKHFADMSVWGVMAKVLAVYKIMNPLNENGAEIRVEPKFSTGTTMMHYTQLPRSRCNHGSLRRRPLPFKCRIIPRDPGIDAKKLEQLIAASSP